MDPSTTLHVILLSAIIFLPAVGALIVAVMPASKEQTEGVKYFTLGVTILTFLLTLLLLVSGKSSSFYYDIDQAGLQKAFSLPWIPTFGIDYFLGLDGISFPLVVLTSFTCVLAMGASWTIDKHVKAYCVLYLLLETGMLGVFMALDFFLFYVFWEVMLLPMYFLIGVWGGPRREYAAIKFFLYTLLGSVFMLIAILMLYFASDLRELSPQQLLASHAVSPTVFSAEKQAEKIAKIKDSDFPVHTFNIMAMQQMGQTTDLFRTSADDKGYDKLFLGQSLEWWAFLLLLVGFIIKVPSVPLHTWLPDAHVEAPTPISMILAGVLLKMGGYGILRICYPICPHAAYDLAYFVCALGVVSMVYGAFAALAQKDFKRLVAYSSVSHMGYVMLGIGVWSAVAATDYSTAAWKMGTNGAMFQMLAHGISSPGMFFLVGVVYERVHHRDLNKFGGLFAKMPVYSGMAIAIFFAGLGLPGLCGFIGEVLVTLSVWSYSKALAVISASVVILTAAYILWTIQRVYLGPEYKGPHGDHLYPMTIREKLIAVPLVALAIVFGVYPQALLRYTTPTIDKQVQDLANWTKDNIKQVPATLPAPATETAELSRVER